VAREYQRLIQPVSRRLFPDFGSEEEGGHLDMESYPRYCSATNTRTHPAARKQGAGISFQLIGTTYPSNRARNTRPLGYGVPA
jgi:hypothetical protein